MKRHKLYIIDVEVSRTRDSYDLSGELTGKGVEYRATRKYRVLASSQLLAKAWVEDQEKLKNPVFQSIEEVHIDGFIENRKY